MDNTGKNIYKAEHTEKKFKITAEELEIELDRVKKRIRIRNNIVTGICLAIILLIIIKNVM